MRTGSIPRFGDLERVVMEQLWDDARDAAPGGAGLTVRDVHERISRTRQIAYTTVMTVLDRLAKKHLVTREREGRAWRYQPADSREALTADIVRRTLDDMGIADRKSALMYFLDGASSDDIADLKVVLAEVEARVARSSRPPRRGGSSS